MIQYLDDLFVVRDILSKGKTVLMLSDTVWCMMCDAFNPIAVQKINNFKSASLKPESFILVESINTIKTLTDHIHPRIETLLLYHNRPINIIYNAHQETPQHLVIDGKLTIRYTKDPLLSDLLKILGNPIYASPARSDKKSGVFHLDQIEQNIKIEMDYIFSMGKNNKSTQGLATLISFDENGELIFHRK